MSARALRARRAIGRRDRRAVAAVAAVATVSLALLALLPFLTAPGIVATRAAGDSAFLLQRTHQMASALADGHFPPRWMPDAAYGLGYPFWTYYAPLVWMVAGAIAALGGGVVGAIKVTTSLCFVVAALGAARLARGEWSVAAPGAEGAPATRGAGLLAAAAYTFAPYHLVNVYARGDALSELAAYAVFPWLLVAIRRAVAAPSSRRIGRLAFLVAALGLSHNISALIFAPLAVAYGLWRAAPDIRRLADGVDRRRPERGAVEPGRALGWRAAPAMTRSALRRLEWRLWPWLRLSRRPIAALIAGCVLGAGLAAWFVVPALVEGDAVQIENALGGHFEYTNHFRGLDLLDLGPAFDFDAETGAPSRLGLLQLLMAVAGALAWLGSRKARSAALFWIAASVASILMATPISRPVWSVLPILHFAQFPWRWLGVASLALAVSTAPLAPWLAERVRRPLLGGPLAFLMAAGLALSGMADLEVEPLAVGSVDVADLDAFELFSGNIGSTVREEYLPSEVVPRPRSSAHIVEGGVAHPRSLGGRLDSAVRLRDGAAWRLWQVEVSGDTAAEVAFPTLWFPGWTATIDDERSQTTRAAPGSGWIVASVPPGRHVVELRLGRSPARAAAEVVSLLALLCWLALMSLERGRGLWLRLLLFVLALAASVGIARLMPDGAGAGGPRTLDWSRAPYPHDNPGGIPFGDVRLVAATIDDGSGGPTAEEGAEGWANDPPTVEAGGGLSVDLEWSGDTDGLTVETALVSPAAVQPGFEAPDVRAIARQRMADYAAHALTLPEETPSGLYFVRVRVFDDQGAAGGQDEPASDRDEAAADDGRPSSAPEDDAGDEGGPEGDAGGEGAPLPALSPTGARIDPIYLGPVRVRGRDRFRSSLPPTPVLRADGIVLHSVQAVQDGRLLEARLLWETDAAPTVDFKTSIRLLPPSGDDAVTGPDGERVQVDQVPLYGMTPPTAWRPGQLVHDRRWLRLPDDLPAGESYRLEIVLYEGHGEQRVLGTGRVSAVAITDADAGQAREGGDTGDTGAD